MEAAEVFLRLAEGVLLEAQRWIGEKTLKPAFWSARFRSFEGAAQSSRRVSGWWVRTFEGAC